MITLERLDPNKLFVEYRQGVTADNPIMPRKHTLTHSDETGNLFLTIGTTYAYDKVNPMRDEVLGEWQVRNNKYIYFTTVYVDGAYGPMLAAIRNAVFIRELPLALEAIRYGDKELFETYPYLDNAPIYIYFKSSYPQYNRTEYWGTFAKYK